MPRDLDPVQVLTIIIQRLEKRADCLEGVRMGVYDVAAGELRNFARIVKAARDYLVSKDK